MHLEPGHQIAELREVDLDLRRGRSLDQIGPVFDDCDLTALEAMPRVVRVLVVRPEHELEDDLTVDAVVGSERGHVRERRRGEHAVEVEEDGVDCWHASVCVSPRTCW